MPDILDRLRNSSPDEGSFDLYCRLLDAAKEIERLRAFIDASRAHPEGERKA